MQRILPLTAEPRSLKSSLLFELSLYRNSNQIEHEADGSNAGPWNSRGIP
jgi:hypothetical protein